MDIIKQYLTKNRCYIKNEKITPKGVIIHSDGCKAGIKAKDWFNRWNNSKVSTAVHFFVDDKEIFNYLPCEKGNAIRPWGCGKGNKGSGNDTHIQFEICEPKDYNDKEYFNAVYQRAVELTAYLLKEIIGTETVNEDTVLCHSEAHKKGIASNHADVMHWFPKHDKTMDDFRTDVKKALQPKEISNDTLYRVQTGAFRNLAYAITLRDSLICNGFTTYMVQNNGLYKVQVGAFTKKENADRLAETLEEKGYDTYITTQEGTPVKVDVEPKILKVGAIVRVRNGAKTYEGKDLANFVYDGKYDVIQISGNRVVIGKGKTVTAAVNKSDLILI